MLRTFTAASMLALACALPVHQAAAQDPIADRLSLSLRRAATSSTFRYSGSSCAGVGVIVVTRVPGPDATPNVRVRPCVGVGDRVVSFAGSGMNVVACRVTVPGCDRTIS